MNFKVKDTDYFKHLKAVSTLYKKALNNPGKRSKEKILEDTLMGIACEIFMVDKMNAKFCNKKYHDIILDDLVIECKSSRYHWNEYRMLDKMKTVTKYYKPDLIMFWYYDGNGEFIFEGYVDVHSRQATKII